MKEISKCFFAISVISEIELLGKKDIAKNEIRVIENLLHDCVPLPFTGQVKDKTIELKQNMQSRFLMLS